MTTTSGGTMYKFVQYNGEWFVFKGHAFLDTGTVTICTCRHKENAELVASALNGDYFWRSGESDHSLSRDD